MNINALKIYKIIVVLAIYWHSIFKGIAQEDPIPDTIKIEMSGSPCIWYRDGIYKIYKYNNNDSSLYALGSFKNGYKNGNWIFFSKKKVIKRVYYQLINEIPDKKYLIECDHALYDSNKCIIMRGEFKNGKLENGIHYILPDFTEYENGKKLFYYKNIEHLFPRNNLETPRKSYAINLSTFSSKISCNQFVILEDTLTDKHQVLFQVVDENEHGLENIGIIINGIDFYEKEENMVSSHTMLLVTDSIGGSVTGQLAANRLEIAIYGNEIDRTTHILDNFKTDTQYNILIKACPTASKNIIKE